MPFDDLLHGIANRPTGQKTVRLRTYWNQLVLRSICDLSTPRGDWFTRPALLGFLLGAGVDFDVATHVADNAPDGGWSIVDPPAARPFPERT